MSYTDIIRDLLDQLYPQPEETKSLIIANVVLRILPLPARPYFLRYKHLETLVITKCDLRNLENFPKILTLKQLDLSDNSLHGTLNYLMPLQQLNYLNISNNLVNDFRKLQPLSTIQGLQIYVAGNPFIDGETWKNKVKNYGLKVLKQPRVLQVLCKKVKQQEKREQKKDQKQQKQPKEQKQRKQQKQPQQIQPANNNVANHTIIHSNLFIEMRARRQRKMLEQQRIQAEKRNVLQVQSDSLSLFADLRQHQINNMFQNQEDEEEQSEQLNDFEHDQSDKDQREEDDNDDDDDGEPENYMNDGFAPLLDPFDGDEDLQRNEGNSQEDSSD